ncbi:hypothetical protein CJF31_00004520 [Rutstroemia sp. NJR-2017a BVV2]|nr:hypothetical protein CJF31_00004520 [Rutstroemia sp. NJR-2017a BVV2]
MSSATFPETSNSNGSASELPYDCTPQPLQAHELTESRSLLLNPYTDGFDFIYPGQWTERGILNFPGLQSASGECSNVTNEDGFTQQCEGPVAAAHDLFSPGLPAIDLALPNGDHTILQAGDYTGFGEEDFSVVATIPDIQFPDPFDISQLYHLDPLLLEQPFSTASTNFDVFSIPSFDEQESLFSTSTNLNTDPSATSVMDDISDTISTVSSTQTETWRSLSPSRKRIPQSPTPSVRSSSTHHRTGRRGDTGRRKRDRYFCTRCTIFPQGWKLAEDLRKHNKGHHTELGFYCASGVSISCEFWSSEKNRYIEHLLKEHAGSKTVERIVARYYVEEGIVATGTTEKRYRCRVEGCGKVFKWEERGRRDAHEKNEKAHDRRSAAERKRADGLIPCPNAYLGCLKKFTRADSKKKHVEGRCEFDPINPKKVERKGDAVEDMDERPLQDMSSNLEGNGNSLSDVGSDTFVDWDLLRAAGLSRYDNR